MQRPPGTIALAALLTALLVAVPVAPAGAQDEVDDPEGTGAPEGTDGPGTFQPTLVPGTERTDLLAEAPRTWSLEERQEADPRRPVMTGEPEEPARGVIAAQVFTDLAAVEAALLRPQDDGRRFQPVFNVGALLSTLRFDPPLPLDQGEPLRTIDAPRLPWEVPSRENFTSEDPETGAQHVITRLSMHAQIPSPGDNGTSPPPGGGTQDDTPDGSTDMDADTDTDTDTDTGLRLTWHVTITNRSIPYPLADLSSATIRFTWTLEGPDGTFDADQRLRWVFLYDYDIVRPVVRPEPIDAMDGAYLVSGDHRAALRLATVHHPLDPRDEGGTVHSESVDLDVRPSAGGDGPDAEARPLPSPLVLEAHTRAVGHETRGYTYSGELRFFEAAPDGDNGDDDGPGGTPDGAWPFVPRLWQALIVVAIAVLLLMPWRRRATPSTTP